MKLFLQKKRKIFERWGPPPPSPKKTSPPLRISGYAPDNTAVGIPKTAKCRSILNLMRIQNRLFPTLWPTANKLDLNTFINVNTIINSFPLVKNVFAWPRRFTIHIAVNMVPMLVITITKIIWMQKDTTLKITQNSSRRTERKGKLHSVNYRYCMLLYFLCDSDYDCKVLFQMSASRPKTKEPFLNLSMLAGYTTLFFVHFKRFFKRILTKRR